jgi:Fur family peroxide stress response transcriptional regulator
MTDSNSTERINHLADLLRSNGFRITPQRLAVLKLLISTDRHPSVDQIYAIVKKDFPTTSLATVYKTITVLKEIGEVLELTVNGDGCRYDGNKPYSHPHLICSDCKSITDLEEFPKIINELPDSVAQYSGYHNLQYRLDFIGICPACAGMKQ